MLHCFPMAICPIPALSLAHACPCMSLHALKCTLSLFLCPGIHCPFSVATVPSRPSSVLCHEHEPCCCNGKSSHKALHHHFCYHSPSSTAPLCLFMFKPRDTVQPCKTLAICVIPQVSILSGLLWVPHALSVFVCLQPQSGYMPAASAVHTHLLPFLQVPCLQKEE